MSHYNYDNQEENRTQREPSTKPEFRSSSTQGYSLTASKGSSGNDSDGSILSGSPSPPIDRSGFAPKLNVAFQSGHLSTYANEGSTSPGNFSSTRSSLNSSSKRGTASNSSFPALQNRRDKPSIMDSEEEDSGNDDIDEEEQGDKEEESSYNDDDNDNYDNDNDDNDDNDNDESEDDNGRGTTNGKKSFAASNGPTSYSSLPVGQSVILSQVPRYEILTVSQPQKVSDGSSSYVSYLITSQQYPEEKPERVRRRFSDFAKLHDRLLQEFPACTIPPLPDRWRLEYIAGDRFSSDFTSKRAASLERFLFRVSQHPSLRKSKSFILFLSAGGLGASAAAAEPSRNNSVSNGNGGPDSSLRYVGPNGNFNSSQGGDSAAMVALDHISEALMNAFAKARHQSKEMIDARERADRFEQNIATIDKAVVRATKTQNALALDFEDMHQQAKKLARLEPPSEPEFQLLGKTAQCLMGATAQLRSGVDSHCGCALRDMSHYVQALKGMLKQREQRQIDYEALVEYLKRSEHELVAAEHGQPAPAFTSSFLKSKLNELRGIDKEQVRQQRIAKLKSRITEFKEESAKAKQISDDYEELAKREVRVFDQTEAIELQQSLLGLSDSYIEFFQTVLRDCRDLAAQLE